MCDICQRSEWGLTLVRIVLGIIFIIHGGQKVMGWFGGPGLEGFVTWAAGFGIPSYLAYLAAFAEFVGGWFLLLGLLPELGAFMTLCVMLGAVFLIHWPHGFFAQKGGFEYPLSLALFDLAIIIGGHGKLALWCPCMKKSCKI